MDYQTFVDQFATACCVMSVEKSPDGGCGQIHILCGNSSYREIMGPAFHDGMPYQELVPKDLKFEDFCYRAAFLKQRMHAYVETKGLGTWTDQIHLPMKSDRDDIGYVLFQFEYTKKLDPSRMALVSIDTAAAVVKASFALLGADDFYEGLLEVVSQIQETTDALCCRILLLDHQNRKAIRFCEKLREDFDRYYSDQLPFLGDGEISYEIARSWEDTIGVSNEVIVKNESEMSDLEKRNPAWVANMRSFGIRSVLLIPLRRKKEIIGYLYVVNFNTENVVEIKEILEMISLFLAPELSNHLLMEELERIGNIDALTGLNNRRAMNRRWDELSRRKKQLPCGIIVVDLNGLKKVNDECGHESGDLLINSLVRILEGFFSREDIFRIGGDEFLVITEKLSREDFEDKVERLSEESGRDPNLCFASGSFWHSGETDLHTAFRIADSRMYEDKKQYYLAHPDQDSRNRGNR